MANNKKVEDIFDEVDKSSVTQKSIPKKKNKIKTPIQVDPTTSSNIQSIKKEKSKVPFYVMLVFIFLVVSGIAYLIITGTFTDTVETGTNTVVNTVTGVVDEVTGNGNSDNSNTSKNGLDIKFDNSDSKVIDTDGDGILDEEEKKLGTSVTSVDTDGDGLFDREEIEVYNTDPLNNDTDGDGKLDGVEVDNGYNPNGAGLLLDLQKEIDNLQK